ncbi:MARVEL domain-containing protein sing [Arctopsyche grandis]|uniref:MARVEL domain-containing protein sing n=1 Tax=Arctopsyche grandis TaxID=121162 RepID=UPI00406D6AB0
MVSRGPTVRMASSGNQGIRCCCCSCCNCLNLTFLTSRNGLIKFGEAILGSLCQSLLIEFGMSEATIMGAAFHGFLTTASACVLTTSILIASYVFSAKSESLVRQSIFEFMFNLVACLLYLSASSCMAASVNFFLYPKYALVKMYSAYPAMTAVYYIGAIVGVLHGVDAYFAMRYYKGIR